MLIGLIGAAIAVILTLVALATINKLISDGAARAKFRRLSRNLPMCPGVQLLGNHITTILIGKNNCQRLKVDHDRLGNTIGWLVGSTFCVSTIDLDLIKTIVQDEPYVHLNRVKLGVPVEEFRESIMLTDKDEWRQLRKIIEPALASNKFKTPNVQSEINASISKLIEHIDRELASHKPDHLFEVDDFVHKYTLDLIFRCFYKQEGLVDFDDPNDMWTKNYDQGMTSFQTSIFVKISLIFPQLCSFVDWLIWQFAQQGHIRYLVVQFVKSQAKLGLEARKKFQQLKEEAQRTGTKIDDNIVLEDGTKFRRNMIDHVIDKFLDGKMTKRQYFNNGAFLLAAGEKTAFDAIVHTIYLLSINTNVQDELRKSINENGLSSEYLDWVLKESMRLLPPAPIGCSRTVERDIEIENGRYILPAGTFVHTNAYVIHRLKKYWGDDADEFRPDRWRDTSRHHPFQYITFGSGPRGCPGKMFAMHEMKMVFAVLLPRYKFLGRARDDAYTFSSPCWAYVLPNSATKVTIERL